MPSGHKRLGLFQCHCNETPRPRLKRFWPAAATVLLLCRPFVAIRLLCFAALDLDFDLLWAKLLFVIGAVNSEPRPCKWLLDLPPSILQAAGRPLKRAVVGLPAEKITLFSLVFFVANVPLMVRTPLTTLMSTSFGFNPGSSILTTKF